MALSLFGVNTNGLAGSDGSVTVSVPSCQIGDVISVDYLLVNAGGATVSYTPSSNLTVYGDDGFAKTYYVNTAGTASLQATMTGGTPAVLGIGLCMKVWRGSSGTSSVTPFVLLGNFSGQSSPQTISGTIPNGYGVSQIGISNASAISISNSTNEYTFQVNTTINTWLTSNVGANGTGISQSYTFSGGSEITGRVYTIAAPAGSPDFSISTPPSVNCNNSTQDTNVAFSHTITITPLNGFTGVVNLSLNLFPGAAASLSTTSVSLASGPQTVVVTGSYPNFDGFDVVYQLSGYAPSIPATHGVTCLYFGCMNNRINGYWYIYLTPSYTNSTGSIQTINASVVILDGSYTGVINLSPVLSFGAGLSGLPATVTMTGANQIIPVTITIPANCPAGIAVRIIASSTNPAITQNADFIVVIQSSGPPPPPPPPPTGDFSIITDLPTVLNNGQANTYFGALFVTAGATFNDTITITLVLQVSGVNVTMALTVQSLVQNEQIVFPFVLTDIMGLTFNNVSVVQYVATGSTTGIVHTVESVMITPGNIINPITPINQPAPGFGAIAGSELRHVSLRR